MAFPPEPGTGMRCPGASGKWWGVAEAGVPCPRAAGFKRQWEQATVCHKGDFVLLQRCSVFKPATEGDDAVVGRLLRGLSLRQGNEGPGGHSTGWP